jgi:hypothetical protein
MISLKNPLVESALCAVWLVVAGAVVTAKPWRGIVPLKSTRVDVERLLGSPKQSSEFDSYYSLPNEIVVVHFQATACDELGFEWNVPPDTVIEIGVIPKGQHRREEYLPSDAKSDDGGAGFVYYSDAAAGFTVETYKDLVTLLEYSPEAAQENLRCPRKQTCCIHPSFKFDEYGQLPFGDEKARLDNFVIHLHKESVRGVIQVVGPSKRIREQLLKRAARGKSYLVKKRGIEPERLFVVDGGYNRDALIRLSFKSIGGLFSRMIFFPERDPK